LENARAYIMTIVYVLVTVTAGYPLLSFIAGLAGLDMDNSPFAYIVRLLDAALYIWLPQINIFLLRLIQGRNLRHRMVGRTVVIGDIPWVAQSAEAFLSKIFAVSYSIAGVNVLSGNPCDHLVHRHTHRVVRGALAIFGRPDGRLSALSTAEASVCLSVSQASSIQSLGGTCESVTIGHNPSKLDLSKSGIFLNRHRPLFLCEQLLVENDLQDATNAPDDDSTAETNTSGKRASLFGKLKNMNSKRLSFSALNLSRHSGWGSRHGRNSSMGNSRHGSDHSVGSNSRHGAKGNILGNVETKGRSAAALLGAYLNIEDNNSAETSGEDKNSVAGVVAEEISRRKWSSQVRSVFETLDENNDGSLTKSELIQGAKKLNPEITEEEAERMFANVEPDANGNISIDALANIMAESKLGPSLKAPASHRDHRGMIQVEMSNERFFGETVRRLNAKRDKKDVDFTLARDQHLIQELYETRIASLQRFVAMTVMFHHMGRRVENFFSNISFGLLGYRMDRTHSIMRIATTASPVSGADVRHRMEHMRLVKKVNRSLDVISSAYLRHRKDKHEKEA